MINDKQKIAIAKNFNEHHAMSVSAWTPDKDYASDDEHYLTIYDNLMMGVYGDCYGINAEYDEDGELITEATEYEVEVVQFESPQEQSEKFTFELTSEPSSFAQFIEAHGRSGNW